MNQGILFALLSLIAAGINDVVFKKYSQKDRKRALKKKVATGKILPCFICIPMGRFPRYFYIPIEMIRVVEPFTLTYTGLSA